ncbi:dolichyl-phosphate-mannose--protein mannosyltransferase [Zafaria sp. J156]|uniref:dolichyl-phosphate-mannose--protein mannosyltransferase n=1 Tax=Zafaria sp. J156 TaxID=3116490 RepID=UPI002E793D75|nr:phospholipid carrier-dependent glycosyltransferase [Zafaria sp. J156]MEE1619957.1 phospholipid carrier-dependent glycosyltransferase [Zafaria sp. J156]
MSASTGTTSPRWVRDPADALGETSLRGRLLGPAVAATRLAWIVPLAVTALAALLRFWNLSHPHAFTFDETYYIKDAYTLLESGYERSWPDEANDAFIAGSPAPNDDAAYVVHPPLGKWLIGLGMLVFGWDNGLGWRSAGALAGTLSVLLLALAAQRLFRSPVLGGLAGLLSAVDGHHLVMSRTALLDIFQMFFLLAAFYLLLVDRDDGRRRLAQRLAAAVGGGAPDAPRTRDALLYGPWLAWRPWRLAAGILLGAAAGVKWSSLSFIAVFGLMTVLWDVSARRAAGIRRWFTAGILRDGVPAFLTMIPAAVAVYVATWSGWLATSGGYHRDWASQHPEQAWPLVPGPLRSLIDYHRSAYSFHQGLSSDHSWESGPWTWLFAGRPVLFYYEGVESGEPGCAAASCSAVITDLPNPVLWWAASLSACVVLLFWAGRRDWRAGAILSGLLAGFVPWFLYPERTMFFFYTISFHPFMVLALTYALGLVLGRRDAPPERRRAGVVAVAVFLFTVVALSAFFWPVWTGETIPYEQWRLRIWMPSWA